MKCRARHKQVFGLMFKFQDLPRPLDVVAFWVVD